MTFDELMERVRLRDSTDIGDAAVDAIRKERDAGVVSHRAASLAAAVEPNL